jgi:hypothetical protein
MDSGIPKASPLPNPGAGPVAPSTVASGPTIAAIDRIKLFDSTEWEEFVTEWVDSIRPAYAEVRQLAGPGDQGRDVIGVCADGSWDNFQCKHVLAPLTPSDVWVELGKLLYYTYKREFEPPRRFYFVAPLGVGTKLSNLLREPKKLQDGLTENWDKYCKDRITETGSVPLESGLLDHLKAFDFSIFDSVAPHRLIDGHAKTRWHAARFGGGLPPRTPSEPPPPEPSSAEAPYVHALLDAYADHLGRAVEAPRDIPEGSPVGGHFADARREFYSAEALRTFSRDYLPPGSFEELQDQIHSGIGDALRGDHDDGYRRVVAVVGTALVLPLDGHALNTSMVPRDRGGICHQLANAGTIEKWVS